MSSYGARSMTATLRRVLVRPPQPADAARWQEYGWRAEPDVGAAAAEHEALRVILEVPGAEVIVAEGERGNPDAIYAYDPVLVGEEGAVLLRPGKDGRLGEPGALEAELERAGVPVVARIEGRGRSTAATRSGSTPRRSSSGAATGRTPKASSSSQRLPGRRGALLDLPHWNGRAEVMHLMSLISPLDDDLALVYPRLAPVRLLELLAERGIEIVEVPDEEFETMGPNVLALGPRRALALEGNDETRRRMEAAGVEVSSTRATRSPARATAARPA